MKKFFTVCLVLAGICLAISIVWHIQYQKIVDRCVGYDQEWVEWRSMDDCYGVISIWGDDNGGYDIENNIDRGWYVANIRSLKDFSLIGDKMYVIDRSISGICNNLVPNKYCGQFRVNGESKNYYYDHPEQVPKYLIIDTKTGNEQFFVKLEEIPIEDRQVFEALIKK